MSDVKHIPALIGKTRTRGSHPCIVAVHGGVPETWSSRDLAESACRLAAGLAERGLRPGKLIALYAPNAPQWIIASLAAWAAGATVLPIDDLTEPEAAARLLRDNACRWLFTSATHAAQLAPALAGHACDIVLIDREEGEGGEAIFWRNLLRPSAGNLADPDPDSPAALFYTSGTTGEPKAFHLSHRNIMANVEAIRAADIVGPHDRALLPLPLHHAYPTVVGLLTPLATGTTIVLPESATGPLIVQALRAARVTVIVGVPRLYDALAGAIESGIAARGAAVRLAIQGAFALSAWVRSKWNTGAAAFLLAPLRRKVGQDVRLLVSGGAPLDREVQRKLEALGWLVLSGYGLAETASVFTCNRPQARRLGSAGQPLGDGRARIADPDERGIGEVELCGASITSGYLDDPESNRNAFTEDGWFRTGDLGYFDEDGFLFITGRARETIVLPGGKKLSPESVERIYAATPLIQEIALLERTGKLVGLVRPDLAAIRAQGATHVRDALRVALTQAAQQLPSYQRLSGFAVTDQPLPRTLLGKYQRFLLPDLYDAAQRGLAGREPRALSEADRGLLADPVAADVWGLLQRRFPQRGLDLDTSFYLDLGVDSFGWMNLTLELEKDLGVTVSDAQAESIDSVRDLLEAVSGASAAPPPSETRVPLDPELWVRPPGPVLRALGFALYGVNCLVMRLFFSLRAEGLAALPREGAFVVTANHASDLDPLVLAAALPWRFLRRTYWSGDVVRLFRGRAGRLLCRIAQVYPVDERNPAAALRSAALVLGRGKVQVWFPEAWRSPDGELQRFLPGIGRLLRETGVPAVPAYISGAFEAMPRNRRWPRRHPIRVIFGTAGAAAELAPAGGGNSEEERIAGALRDHVARLAAGAKEAGGR